MLSFVADCSRCAGLCCIALPYQASADFPVSKPADRPCRHLDAAGRCGIHGSLAEHGWHGCVAFDCAGAGPHTVHTTYGGDGLTDPRIGATASTTWTAATAWTAAERYAVFRTLLSVFEVGAHVAEARSVTATTGGRAPDPALAAALAQVAARVEQVAKLPAEALTTYDPGLLRALAGPLLRRTAATVRTAYARDRRPFEASRRNHRPGPRRRPRRPIPAWRAAARRRPHRRDPHRRRSSRREPGRRLSLGRRPARMLPGRGAARGRTVPAVGPASAAASAPGPAATDRDG